MNIRLKREVNEIKNKEESSINNATTYKYTVTKKTTADDKKKLEPPTYSYRPSDDIRVMSTSDEAKRKLR